MTQIIWEASLKWLLKRKPGKLLIFSNFAGFHADSHTPVMTSELTSIENNSPSSSFGQFNKVRQIPWLFNVDLRSILIQVEFKRCPIYSNPTTDHGGTSANGESFCCCSFRLLQFRRILFCELVLNSGCLTY